MKRLMQSPYLGLIGTGAAASAALLIEARLPVSQELHFLLQFVWLGVLSAALLAFALHPALERTSALRPIDNSTPEWFDADRRWLQAHPDVPPQEQEQE
ncbi:MAG: hypothetical protein SF162_03780 [bacterium]|nr:hypothetical protein [bacterium]